MHRTVLAPELSATLRRLSCWIIAAPGAFEAVDDPPPRQLRGGTGLLDADPVALLEVVDLVVGVEPGGPLEGLLVTPVADPVDDGHDHGLLHLGGDDGALPDLAAVGAVGGGRCRVTHSFSPASAASISFSRSTVRIRAMSWRTAWSRAELSSWPVTIWKRRLKSSCLASARRFSSSPSSAARSSSVTRFAISPPPPAARSAS